MDDTPIEVIEAEIEAREEAEKDGLYDIPVLTDGQEYEVWDAMSTLSRLAKETNSSMSSLLKAGGYANVVKELAK